MKYVVGMGGHEDQIEAGTAAELVRQMHKLSRTPAMDDQAWMAQVAGRSQVADGSVIRTNTADNFVADLIKAGHVKEVGL